LNVDVNLITCSPYSDNNPVECNNQDWNNTDSNNSYLILTNALDGDTFNPIYNINLLTIFYKTINDETTQLSNIIFINNDIEIPIDYNDNHSISHPLGCYNELIDSDLDELCDGYDLDDDNDGILDTEDVFPLDPTESSDSDEDGTGDNSDICPFDPFNDADSDGVCGDIDQCDGFDDSIDTDLDGIVDGCDVCPFDADNDTDGDGICGDVDQCDGFDDNIDTDLDGIANGCDEDDDNDGIIDSDDSCPQGNSSGDDYDEDGCFNSEDNDDDNDGDLDIDDSCPFDADNDADNDDICGDIDVCPFDYHNDMDGDNICGCTITQEENFYIDDTACIELYGEGNYDTDNDDDGIPNDLDACPNAADGHDWDADGICDSSDPCVGEGSNEDDCISADVPVADKLILLQNYPNPFNPTSTIKYSIPKSGMISMNLIDINGRLVKKLINNKYHSKGDNYSYIINAENLNSGVYFIQLISFNDSVLRKIAVIK